jgi:drug/metabolite transporter (DMT)-like permease
MASINRKSGPRHSIKFLKSYHKAVLALVCASVIWGTSFTFTRWALEDFSTTTLIFWRFFIAFLLGEFLLFVFQKKSYQNSHSDIKLASTAGLFLGGSILLQTHGLHTTTATNSSFITSLYVVIVPIIAFLFFKHKLKIHHIILGLLAFAGMGLLLNLQGEKSFLRGELFNWGDLLTLFCAIAASFHIILVGQSANIAKSAFRFNNYQSFWSLLLVIPFLIYEMMFKNISLWPETFHLRSVVSLLIMAVMASIFAFYLQIKAQKILSNTTSSLLCLLEAPNAFLFAAFFLGEKLDYIQLIGVVIILSSSFFSVYMDRPQNRQY